MSEAPQPRRDVVVAATVIVVAMIVAVTVLVLAGKPTSAIVIIVVPLVLVALAFFGARLQAGQQQIQTQVNGNSLAQLQAMMELARLLAVAHPVAGAAEPAPATVEEAL